jgi:hypothetical protein
MGPLILVGEGAVLHLPVFFVARIVISRACAESIQEP